MHRILSPKLKARYGGRMQAGHTVGQCDALIPLFHASLPYRARCDRQVMADTGYTDGTSFFCPQCVARIRQTPP